MTYKKEAYSFIPPTTGEYTFAIRVNAPFAPMYLSFDDFSLDLTPTCPSPTALGASVTDTRAILSWTAGGAETQWQVEYGIGNYTFGTGTRHYIGHHPDTLQSLTQSTAYNYYVRGICGANDTSAWNGPFSFSTAMTPLILPYALDFERGIGTWLIANAGQANLWYNGVATGFNSDSSLYITNDNGVSNSYDTSTSSVVHFYNDVLFTSGIAEFNLSFDWKASGESTYDHIKVFLVDPSVTPVAGTQLTTGQIGEVKYNLQTTWQHATISLPGTLAGSAKRLVFTWRNDGSGGTQPPAAIDNISIIPIPCGSPYTLTATNITTTSAHLGWVSPASATQWQIEYGIGNYTFGTGTRYFTLTNPDTLENLLPSNSYKFYVRAICGVGDTSVWSVSANFNTVCLPISATYNQNFDAVIAPNLPNCWSKYTSPSYTFQTVNTYTTSPYNTPNCVQLYCSGASLATDAPLLISPKISDINSGLNQLRFYAKGASSNTSVIVGTMSDPLNNSTFTPLQTITGLSISLWTEYTFSFA